jgi:predicted Zn-dependent peptidase
VNTGSRDESAQINGISHFLEHMMFKGSEKYTWQDVNRIFDEMGARYNAFTSQEMTGYYANVLPEFTQKTIEHLSHLLRPALRQSDFETEKKVIIEEISMYLDDPGHRIYEKAMEAHFPGHPLGMSVLGSAKSVQDMTQQQMAEYFSRRYGPGNTVVAIAGNLEFDRVFELVEQYCGHWPTVSAGREQPLPVHKSQQVAMVDPKLNRQYTMGLTPGPSTQDPRRFAARVLADVIGDAEGSRLYWALVDNALAEEADFGFYPHDRYGSFYFSLSNEPARTQKVQDILVAELERVKDDLADDEVQRAKNKIASQIVLSGELPIGRMRSLGAEWIYNHEYRSLEQDMEALRGVTTGSLKQLMRDFPFQPMTVATLGPR